MKTLVLRRVVVPFLTVLTSQDHFVAHCCVFLSCVGDRIPAPPLLLSRSAASLFPSSCLLRLPHSAATRSRASPERGTGLRSLSLFSSFFDALSSHTRGGFAPPPSPPTTTAPESSLFALRASGLPRRCRSYFYAFICVGSSGNVLLAAMFGACAVFRGEERAPRRTPCLIRESQLQPQHQPSAHPHESRTATPDPSQSE